MNIVTKSNRKEYLNSKSPAYQSGWFAAEKGYPLKKLSGHPKTQFYYENGYNDCKSNEWTISGISSNVSDEEQSA